MANKFRAISWQAQEYVVREHKTGWYVGLALVTVAFAVLAGVLQAWTFLALVIVSALAILVSTLKPPRTIDYKLDGEGLTEGARLHPYSEFRAFGILQEGENYSAILIPKKRLGLSIKVYFPEGKGEGIVDALGARLPMEEVKLDFLDKIVNFLRI